MPTENDEPSRTVRLQDLLKEERDRRGWSTYAAGAWFGVDQATYWRWEQGKGLYDDKLLKVAEYLGKDIEDVVVLRYRHDFPMTDEHGMAIRQLEAKFDALAGEVKSNNRRYEQILGFLRGLGSRFGVEFVPDLTPPPLPPPEPESEPPADGESTAPGSS